MAYIRHDMVKDSSIKFVFTKKLHAYSFQI